MGGLKGQNGGLKGQNGGLKGQNGECKGLFIVDIYNSLRYD